MVKTYLFLVGAIFCEVAGTMLLPVSQNFTKLIPTTLLTIFYLSAFYLLTFVEGGNTWNNFEAYNPYQLYRSAGIGARIFMPAFGLLGIDFGYGLDSVNEFNLEPNGWETHFVIGQNF